MPMTKRLGAYSDIAAAFDAALAHKGGTLTFDSAGKARNWRQRAYYYRQLLGTAKPQYDKLVMLHEGKTVKISLRQLNAVFTAPGGEKVQVEVDTEIPTPVDTSGAAPDPLLADAMKLVQTSKT